MAGKAASGPKVLLADPAVAEVDEEGAGISEADSGDDDEDMDGLQGFEDVLVCNLSIHLLSCIH